MVQWRPWAVRRVRAGSDAGSPKRAAVPVTAVSQMAPVGGTELSMTPAGLVKGGDCTAYPIHAILCIWRRRTRLSTGPLESGSRAGHAPAAGSHRTCRPRSGLRRHGPGSGSIQSAIAGTRSPSRITNLYVPTRATTWPTTESAPRTAASGERSAVPPGAASASSHSCAINLAVFTCRALSAPPPYRRSPTEPQSGAVTTTATTPVAAGDPVRDP
jgi:hypothetical protein